MDLEDILKKLGWDSGFQMPISNEENKELEEKVARLTLKKNKVKNELEKSTSRLDGLKEHFKYIHQENEQNQKFITAQRQQYEAVEHYYHLFKSEKSSVENDLKKMSKELKELEQRQTMKKNDLQKHMVKAEKLKTETEWDAEALKAWEETLKKREDDIELIKKFSMEDARKYNDLEARRQLLQVESDKKKKALAKLVTDMSNNDMVIERTGKVLKQQEVERNALVKQWKETVNMLRQRDDDVVKAQEQVVLTQELIEKQKERLDEENGFLNNEQRNNHELDLEMESLNVFNSRMRKDFSNFTQDLLMMHSELQALKREVSSSAQQLENERINLKTTNQTITRKEVTCVKFEEDIEKLRKKIEEMKDSSLSSSEKVRNLEKIIEVEEKLYKIYVADTEKLNNLLFRNDKVLKEQIVTGKTLEMDISNNTLFCAQLRKHTRLQKKELEKIKEVVYNMEYRIDEFEKRLLKIEFEAIDDTLLEEKEKKIQELEQTAIDHKAVHHTLQTQVDRLREEMSRLNAAIELDKEQLMILKDKCEQHLLENEIIKKHIVAAKKSTQEKQVEENMMRLRINQIENDMKKEEKMIFSMEKLRLNLDQAMRERLVEINTQKMILQAKRRNLDEDRGRLKGEISMRKIKIDQLQRKYHIMLVSLGKDEEGQPISVATFKIKYAQEKYMLQQQGDALDQKIKTAEKEIVAMENTLKMVNLTNTAFKKSLAPIKDEDKEVQEMKTLEEQLNNINAVFRERKKELLKKRQELNALQEELKEKEALKLKIKEHVTSLDGEFEEIERQETDKATKLHRAECQVKKLLKKLSNVDLSKYDRDFEIRLLKGSNRNVLHKLTELCGLYPEMAPFIIRYTTEYRLSLPEKKICWSSSSSSIHISTSSCVTNQHVTFSSKNSPESTGSEINTNKVNLTFDIK